MSRRSLLCPYLCAVLLIALPAAAQTPDLVMGTVPISAEADEILYAESGLIGAEGFTFAWDCGVTAAWGVFQGVEPGPGEAPPAAAMALHLVLIDGAPDWDLTVQIAWGETAPTAEATWGQVKARYR